MKVRLGFVSNSSSTSFCIYGAYFGDIVEPVKNFLKDKTKNEIRQILSDQYIECEEEDFLDLDDLLSNIEFSDLAELLMSTIKDLTCYECYETNEFWAGLGIESMDDNETKKQFQDRVEKLIKETFSDEDIEASWYEECWMG